MENASKALIIAGAILLSILIIAVGMFIFTSSQTTIQEGATQINAQERNAFNQQFTQFEKKQGGTNVAQLIQNLIANCSANAEENDKLPDLIMEASESEWSLVTSTKKTTATPRATNVSGFTKAKNLVESRHTYYVTVSYNPKTSLVDLIVIEYEKGNSGFDANTAYDDAGTLNQLSTIHAGTDLT